MRQPPATPSSATRSIRNTGLGIDLVGDNAGCPETSISKDPDGGPNNQQNFPVLATATVSSDGTQVTIVGQLDSLPGTDFRIEFFKNDNSESHGEATAYLGHVDVPTDAATGIASISKVLNTSLAFGEYITATATELVAGTPRSTSEFSLNQVVRFKPQISHSGGSTNYDENSAAVQFAPSASVTDPDTVDFNGGSLRVDIASGGTANDRLTIKDIGAPNIALVANEVYHGGSKIGTWSGGDAVANPLQINFDQSTSKGAIEALFAAVSFSNTSENPDETDRVIEFTLTDPDGLDGDKLSRTVTVEALNDDPTNDGGFPVANLNPDEETATKVDLSAIDLDDIDHAGGDLIVRLNSGAGAGTFSAPSQGGVTVGGDGTTTLTLTGTLANLNAFLNDGSLIDYTGALNVAGNGADTIDVEVSDQGNTGSGGGGWVDLGTLDGRYHQHQR